MALNAIPSILGYLASKRKGGLTPEESYLQQMQSEQEMKAAPQAVMQQGMEAGVQLQPEDMKLAQAPDPYGGVSVQTRAAMNRLGQESPEMADMVVSAGTPKPSGGFAAKTGVRGPQSSSQQEQLIKLLMGRGMSREEAAARAKGI